MTEVIMPKMGDGMEEGTLLEWHKKDGDAVKSGEVIGTIQTDKATLELEAPASGTLTGIILAAGGTVPVGRPIAAILKSGEKLPNAWSSKAVTKVAKASKPANEEAATPVNSTDPATPLADARAAARIKASPLAQKVAAQLGVELTSLRGTGPGGRIIERDVLGAETASKDHIEPSQAPNSASNDGSRLELSRLRSITAKKTTESKQQVPHFYVTLDVDVESILALRRMFEAEESGKVSVNDFVLTACAKALVDMPEVNASFDGNAVVRHGTVNIGIAVALPDGLTVPVLKRAESLSLRQIAAKAKELAGAARDNKLGLDELTGSTFSVSNMGMLDVDEFIAIINQPNAAILAVSTVRKRAVVVEGDQIVVRSRMNISGSFDHRVVDGAIGAKFMNRVRGYIENPSRLLI